MNKRLTLTLNALVIEKAKSYAKKHGTRVSKMVESYLEAVTNAEVSESECLEKLVDKDDNSLELDSEDDIDSLVGVVKLPADFDYKKARSKYLYERYIRLDNTAGPIQ